jgi:pimeloyl-ACP methyl ester carboxylesterase
MLHPKTIPFKPAQFLTFCALLSSALLSSALLSSAWAQQQPVDARCTAAEPSLSENYDAATRTDDTFNAAFSHCFSTVKDVQMHYVIGGEGTPLVLLHGWPQTWYEWDGLLPELAKDHLVIAVDLPGLGDSTGSPVSFDKKTLATYIHALVSETLGYQSVNIAAHDLGAGVAWSYANSYPAEVTALAAMDFPLPSSNCPAAQTAQLSYHFPFFQEPGIAELLIDDEVKAFLTAFYPHVSRNPEPISEKEISEFARTYERPQNLTNGFELYRALSRDEQDNLVFAKTLLEVPILVLAQQGAYEFEAACYQAGATSVTGTDIEGAGHWLNEEAPDAVLSELRKFFSEAD